MTLGKKLLVGWHYVRTCIRWCTFSVATGVVCGLVGTLLYHMVGKANEIRQLYPYLLLGLPVAGLIIVKFYHMFNIPEDKGADLIFDSVREAKHVPFQVIVTSAISTVITHLFGGSAGRVGMALQVGGGISSGLSKHFHLHPRDRSLFIMCGMSGLVSVLFGTPLAATFLSMEVISVGVIYYAALLPCLVTAFTSFFVAEQLGVEPLRFDIAHIPADSVMSILRVTLFSVCCALVSILFCVAIKELNRILKNKLPNQYIRVVVGAVAVIAVTALVGSQIYNGSGNGLLNDALRQGTVRPYDFLLKLLLTAITLACGFKGGGVFPAFIIGATFGSFIGPYMGLQTDFAAALGMIAVFCGTVNCPIASVLLSVEVFGGEGIIFFAIACAISFVLSGYATLFPGQNFIYSKLRIEYRTSSIRRRDVEELEEEE